MAVIEILDVSLTETVSTRLRGCNIDTPPGSKTTGHLAQFWGWVLGRESPAVAVELLNGGNVCQRARVNIPRPDVAAIYPRVPEADYSGFKIQMSVLGLRPQIEFLLRAVLKDQSRVPIGVVRLRRCWREDVNAKDNPLVSVIIPCYNQARFLHEAIESALGHTYPHREILVVDDGSIDKTEEVATAYPGVQYIRQENSGVSAARNTGLKRSWGEYLVFLDADDRLLPNALEIGVNALRQHPACAFAWGYCRFITADGSLLEERKPRDISSEPHLEMLHHNYIWCPGSVIYRRSTFDSVVGFDTSLGPLADYDLYLRITRSCPVFCHNQFVVDYRFHGSNMSVDHSRMLREALKVVDAQWDFVKGDSQRTETLLAGRKHWQDYYGTLQMSDQILEVVDAQLPPKATLAVVTGGKRELLRLGGRRGWHFPQSDGNGRGQLFGQGAKGAADVPWIQTGMRYEFTLYGGPEYAKELATISVTGHADGAPVADADPVPSDQAYLIAIPNPVPTPNRFGRTTIAWSTGDGSEGRLYVSEGGEYDSRRPQDSNEAISCLETIRARGAQYLLLPATAFWWLNDYQKFREHIEARYPVVVRDDETCIIFDLRVHSQYVPQAT